MNAPSSSTFARLSFREKLAYGAGDTASNFVWGTLMTFLTYFYTDIYGLPAAAVASLFLFTRVLDGISDLAAGALADRTQTRWGKFRPYLLWMCVPLAVTFVLTFTTPPWEGTAKIAYAWITYNLVMLAYTAINIPYSALSGVITGDPIDRTKLNSYRMTLAQVGGLTVNATTLPLIAFLGAGNDRLGYFFTACLFGVAIVGLFLFSFAGTRERITPPPTQSGALRDDLRMLARNLPWLILFLIGIINMIFLIVRGSVTIHYFKYVLDLAGANPDFVLPGGLHLHKISTLLVAGNLFFIVGAVVTSRIVLLTGKRTAFAGTFLVSALAAAPLYWCGSGQLGLVVALIVVGSVAGGINATLFWTMIADTADFAETHLGRRSTGIIFSATTCAQKLGMGLGGAIVGVALTMVGYSANTTQSPTSLAGLASLVSWVPALGFLVCGAIVFLYPLGKRSDLTIK
jgi:GPH family glycoside/pentoside/hexuronide:cation symporter